jgi:hypothetical protein
VKKLNRMTQILFALLLLSPLVVLAMPLKAETNEIPTEPSLYQIIFVEPTVDVHHERVLVEPNVWHEYEDIGGTLSPNHGNEYGPNEPYAVSVKINTVSPSGYKVTVSIKVAGATQWSGALGAGESSPTITCNDQTTYVQVVNLNDVTVTYTGQIDWVFH